MDNDGDGLVDEGFPDSDGDGLVDCMDGECAVVVAEAEADTTPRVCENPETKRSGDEVFSVEHRWSFRDASAATCTQSVVADLDGDGVDELACGGAGLAVVDAATGELVWDSPLAAIGTFPAVAAADLDGDGLIELAVGSTATGHIQAFDGSGRVLWSSAQEIHIDAAKGEGWLGVADLAGDCAPEVVSTLGSVDAASGATVSQWPLEPDSRTATALAVGDVDLDGEQDVLVDWSRYEGGALRWSSSLRGAEVDGLVPLIVQFDDDADGEVAWVSGLGLQVLDTDGGELLRAAPASEARGFSLACAGDLRGDGGVVVVASNEAEVWAWALPSGEVLWTHPMEDPTLAFGSCVTFDFHGDGALEVVLQAADRVAILDGATGEPLWEDPAHMSATWGEVASIVDIDQDGASDLLATSEYYYSSTRGSADLYSPPSGAWPPGTTIWASPNWSGTEVRPDGSIPRYPARPWLEYNLWRGQPSNPVFGADMRVVITDACVDSCLGGTAHLAVQVSNLGPEGAPADTPIEVYTLDRHGRRTLVSTWDLGVLLWPGAAAAGVEVTLPTDDVRYGVVAIVGQPGDGTACAVPDCDPTNNEAAWAPDCGG